MSEFKYLWFVVDESRTDGVESRRKMRSERKDEVAIRSLVIARSLQLESEKVLYKALFASILLYISETMIEGQGRRGLELGLIRWTTSVVCCVLGERIE